MLADAAKVKPEVVGYRGSAPLLTDLIGGQLPVAVDTLDTLLPQHEGGKIRILAIGGARRVPNTQRADVEEAGLDVVADGWNAFFAPASMPPARVREIARDRSDHEIEGNAEEVSRRQHGAGGCRTRSDREDDRGLSREVGAGSEGREYSAVTGIDSRRLERRLQDLLRHED